MNEAVATDPLWKRRGSISFRILAVNLLALLFLAGSFFYLDGYRARLIDERTAYASVEARLIALALSETAPEDRDHLLTVLAMHDKLRLRLTDPAGKVVGDSWNTDKNGFGGPKPFENSWKRYAARELDDVIDFIVVANVPRPFPGFSTTLAMTPGGTSISLAPDRTHMISASARVTGPEAGVLITDRNVRDIRRIVRAERSLLGRMIGFAAAASILLSLFLARTIVDPLRNLADAAVRVRTGRDREVIVPRLPARSDEIGLLARAVSDMSHALRERIDATEAFAADVAHELKNPLASMASAVESLRIVTRPEQQAQLHDIIANDVQRLDRLISDISDISRIDARLTRMRFELVDLGARIAEQMAEVEARGVPNSVRIAYARPNEASAIVMGVASQLDRVISNLLDNAISFSPPGGIVRIAATRDGDTVVIIVDDQGPGIPEGARESIFERFHSDRPEEEAFGQHSGLGLSIARTIVNGHGGRIEVAAPMQGIIGARLIVRLPSAKLARS